MTPPRTMLQLEPTAAPPAAPRGRPMSAEQIVIEFGTDPVTAQQLFSAKWVRENVPNKVRISHSKVFWYHPDVVAFFEQKRGAR